MSFNPYEFDRDYAPNQGGYSYEMHLSNTFLWMCLGLMITFVVALGGWITGISHVMVYSGAGLLVMAVLQIVVVIAMSVMIRRMSVMAAKGCFVLYSVITGVTISVYFYLFELSSILFVFLTTALFFGVMGLYGRRTKQDLSWLRPALLGGLVVLIVYGLLSMFLPGFRMLDGIMNLVGVVLFLGYVAYDVQKLDHYYYSYRHDPEMLEKASIFAALELYLDFINLFLRLLQYLGKRKD